MLQPARVTVPFLREELQQRPALLLGLAQPGVILQPSLALPPWCTGDCVLLALPLLGAGVARVGTAPGLTPLPALPAAGCRAPSTAALVLWMLYEFPWPSGLSHVCRACCAPLAGCPKAVQWHKHLCAGSCGRANGSCHL